MARVRKEVSKKDLQAAIDATETANGGPFPTLSKLFETVSHGEWARKNLITLGVITTRFYEYKLKAQTKKGQPGRKRADGATSNEPTSERPNALAKFLEPWTRRGLKIEKPSDLVASIERSDAENVAIWEAWEELENQVDARQPRRAEWIAIYKRLGRNLPKSLSGNAGQSTVADGMKINSRVETVR